MLLYILNHIIYNIHITLKSETVKNNIIIVYKPSIISNNNYYLNNYNYYLMLYEKVWIFHCFNHGLHIHALQFIILDQNT